ncbi:MAG: hypothetical protein DYG89_10725 [Caldilinea sp. CFX5]|nr:hypothetical protein [Caldilinea sp. CFX5]
MAAASGVRRSKVCRRTSGGALSVCRRCLPFSNNSYRQQSMTTERKIEMKRKIRCLMPCLLLVILLALPSATKAQETPPPQDPEAVYRAAYAAQNAGDVEASMAFFAESAVSIALPPPPGTTGVFIGKDAIRAATADFVTRSPQIEFVDFQVNGDTVSFTLLLVEDVFRELGVFPIKFSGVAVIQDGLIQSDTWIMDKDSLGRLEAAITLANNKAIIRQAYDQIFSEGKLELLDEVIAADAIDHGFPELRGVEAFKGPIAGMRAAFPDLQAKAEFIIAEGDMVMALATFTGTH